jgi:hypothetical protein
MRLARWCGKDDAIDDRLLGLQRFGFGLVPNTDYCVFEHQPTPRRIQPSHQAIHMVASRCDQTRNPEPWETRMKRPLLSTVRHCFRLTTGGELMTAKVILGATVTLSLAASQAAASTYDEFYAFGDSTVDSGWWSGER